MNRFRIAMTNRRRIAALLLVLPLLAAFLLATPLSGPSANAARSSTDDALQTTQATPGAATVSRSVTLSLASGGNLIGWPGFPTTSTDILAGNSAISVIWVFDASTQTWSSDSEALPASLRTPLQITQGTGLFVVTSAATNLVVPTALTSTTRVDKNFGEVEFWLDQTNPSADTTSVLTRTPDGLMIQIETNGLFPGAYTGWWRIWNDPSACEDPLACNPGDDPDATRWIVPWATGFVVGENGIGSAQAFLGVGFDALPDSYPDIAEDNFQLLAGMIERGGFLDNPGGAAVDFVLKWHGEVDPDADVFFDQVHNQVGSCAQFDPQGNFGCIDIQRVVIHTP